MMLKIVSNGPKYFKAFRHTLETYNAVIEAFSEKDENTNWLIPVLIRVSNDLRTLAESVSFVYDSILVIYLLVL